MDFMSKKNDNLTIVTTPIHHTSYRNIIEKFVKPENIHIIKMNKNYNKIDNLPSVDKCDVYYNSFIWSGFNIRRLYRFQK